MKIEDYSRESGLIILADHKTFEATGRVRKIGVGGKLSAIIEEATAGRESGFIFLDGRGNPWTAQKLSKAYKRLCRKAGLAEDLCLYLQRHQHATEMCEKGGIHAAALSLGHASLNTTMRYVHSDDSLLAKNQDLIGS